MGEQFVNQPGSGIAAGLEGESRERQDQPVHENINGEPKQRAADKRTAQHDRKFEASRVVHRGRSEGDHKVQDDAQERSRQAAPEGADPQNCAGNSLKYLLRGSS